MNEQTVFIFYILAGITAIITVGCLLFLCSKVSKMQNLKGFSDADEYKIQKQIGDVEKAYYHLQRDFIIQSEKRDLETFEIRDYFQKFTELGLGIPDFEELKKLEQLEQPEQGRDGEWI